MNCCNGQQAECNWGDKCDFGQSQRKAATENGLSITMLETPYQWLSDLVSDLIYWAKWCCMTIGAVCVLGFFCAVFFN